MNHTTCSRCGENNSKPNYRFCPRCRHQDSCAQKQRNRSAQVQAITKRQMAIENVRALQAHTGLDLYDLITYLEELS